MKRSPLFVATLATALMQVAACATTSTSASTTTNMSASPPSPDPRVGLRAGVMDSTRRGVILQPAAEASWNLRLVSNTPPTERFVGVTNSDLAFTGNYAIQGNYSGYQVWDISNSDRPTLKTSVFCPASQSDVSIYKNLLFVSGESTSGRLDCGAQGVEDSVSHERLRGIRIFDVTDIANPKYIANVQTCRGSHTHTVVTDLNDKENVYIYVSGSAGVRSPSELPGCSALAPDKDPNSALFRIEVIKVPLAAPQQARIVSSPRIFNDLTAAIQHAPAPQDTGVRAAPARTGPTQCHDITVYPAIGLAGGACGGYGLLLDIRDVANPKRLYAAADSNMSFWHSATFNNDGTKILFTDEWGGGRQPKCRVTDKYEWGANALFTIEGSKLVFKSYYKMPAAQTSLENCVAHNGSLIPIPGRDVMAQSWYQGGVSVFDWTDVSHPKEIAFFDRGPIDGTKLGNAGTWSVYWYNGHLYSSEIGRGLDILDLTPSALISQNEIDAAKTVHFDQLNAQEQPKLVWPASFSLSRAYLDQLERGGGQTAEKILSARTGLTSAEKLSGQARKDALTALATQLHSDANGASDAPKAHKLAFSVGDLAKALPQAQMEVSNKVAGGGIFVPGWVGKIDAKETAAGMALNNAKLAKEGDALHVTTGPAVAYWNPANTASGDYTVKATFKEPKYMSLNNHPHPYGIVIGGSDMGTDQQSYLYCAAYGNGNFIVRGFAPAAFQLNGRGAANPAVNKAAAAGEPVTQDIAMSVKGDKVQCAINGTVVGSYDKSAVVGPGKLKSTDGVYGVRFGHNTEGLVSGLTMTKP